MSWGWDRATAGLQCWFKMESHFDTYPVFPSISIHSKQYSPQNNMAEVVGVVRKRGWEAQKRDTMKRQRESLEWDPCEAGAQVLKLILLNGCRNGAAETACLCTQ